MASTIPAEKGLILEVQSSAAKRYRSSMKSDYPETVCSECGVSANVLTCLRDLGKRPNKLCFDVSTFHAGVCDICLEEKDVTEPRDFFYPDFHLLSRNIIYIKRKPHEDNTNPAPESR